MRAMTRQWASFGGRHALLEDRETAWAFQRTERAPEDPVWTINKDSLLSIGRLIVIDSITAGKQSKTDAQFYPQLLKPFLDFVGLAHEYWRTESADSVRSFADKTNSSCTLVFLSGDTSISEFVTQFQKRHTRHSVTIVPFPLGSGNAYAHSIGLHDPITALRGLVQGSKHHLPLYRARLQGAQLLDGTAVQECYFIIVFSWALHSTLIYQSDKPEMRAKYGTERFQMAARAISERDPHFRLSDGSDLSYLLLASIPKLEASFTISPSSQVSKDELHCVKIPHTDPKRLMDVVMMGYQDGAHITQPEVQYSAIQTFPFTFQIDQSMEDDLSYICIDGTIIKLNPQHNKVEISIVNHNQFFYLN